MKQDKISGAVEIEKKVIDYIAKILKDKEKLEEAGYSILSLYSSMASIWNIINFAFLYGNEAIKEYNKMERANKKVVENGIKLLKNTKRILTYSRSSTVEKILKGIDAEVICSESRPKYEGRILANNLKNVVFVIDSAIFSFIEGVDLILVGTDAILRKGIVNKVGTFALAICAQYNKKPFYVASSTYKFFPFVLLKEENREEVWKNVPAGVKIKNFYFDFTPRSHISYFITEKGLRKIIRKDIEIADEILEIRDKLLERGYKLID